MFACATATFNKLKPLSDPYFANVWFLSDIENGANANTVVDQSIYARTVDYSDFPLRGNRSTTQVKWGTYSWSNTGSGQGSVGMGLDYADPLNAFGTNFTLEFWFYPTAFTSSWTIWAGHSGSAFGTDRWMIGTGTSAGQFDKPAIWINGNPQGVSSTALTLNSWNFLALSNVAGSASLYLNGTRVVTGLSINDQATSVYYFANVGGGAEWCPGYWDGIRLTKGVGRYSGATMVVPSAPFPRY
jgi:hypothetical protein